MRLLAVCLVLLAIGLAACSASRPAPPPEDRFGVRPDRMDDGSVRLEITPPDTTQDYFYAPAILNRIEVRAAPFATPADSVEGVPVEVLIGGSLPDACAELHAVSHARTANLIDVTLMMRRPQGVACATVVRPYRFYVLLDGRYRPGSYTLHVNGRPRPFEILPPDDEPKR